MKALICIGASVTFIALMIGNYFIVNGIITACDKIMQEEK